MFRNDASHVFRVIVLLVLMLFAFSGCQRQSDVPDDTAAREDSQSSSSVTDTTGSGETEPSAPERGIFAVSGGEALGALASDPEFLGYQGIPSVIVGYGISDEVSVTLPRACNLTFRGWFGGTIRMETREAENLTIAGGSDGVYIDAPFCDVIWDDADSDAELRMNVRTLNGNRLTLGGEGTAVLSAMTLTNASGAFYTDTDYSVSGNVITVRIPYFMNDSGMTHAALSFSANGGDICWASGQNADGTVNLTDSPRLTVTDSGGKSRTYLLRYTRFRYDLPVLEIRTENNAPILSKLEYVPSVFSLDGKEYEAMLKGRGNSSWMQFPKKSYSVKLAEKAAILGGCVESKSWSLVSAYCDKTLFRNEIADALSSVMEHIEYTPGQILCDTWLNGEYIGVYTLSEKIEADDGKLNLGAEGNNAPMNLFDTGFLIEMGWDYDGRNIYNWDYFDVRYALRLYVKEPYIEKANNEQLQYIRNYIWQSEYAIITLNGYENYIDVDNFVDWFLLIELTNNSESAFYRSCYMYKRVGGLLRLGPLWDFDMAFGNYANENKAYDTWVSADNWTVQDHTTWMTFLTRDEAFMAKVRERWAEKKELLLQTAMDEIDRQASLVSRSQQMNFEKWNILGKPTGQTGMDDATYNTYEKQVGYLRSFIQSRWTWMDSQLT